MSKHKMTSAEIEMHWQAGYFVLPRYAIRYPVNGPWMLLECELQKIPYARIVHADINALIRCLDQAELALVRFNSLGREPHAPIAFLIGEVRIDLISLQSADPHVLGPHRRIRSRRSEVPEVGIVDRLDRKIGAVLEGCIKGQNALLQRRRRRKSNRDSATMFADGIFPHNLYLARGYLLDPRCALPLAQDEVGSLMRQRSQHPE